MVALSTTPAARTQWREVGRLVQAGIAWPLFAIGWLAAKAIRAAATAVGALLYAIGWIAGAVAWPALRWCGRAVRLGWRDAITPGS